MPQHQLRTYKRTVENKQQSVQKDFDIEVNDDFVTVNRKHQNHSNMLQSKSFKVDKDVLAIIHFRDNDLYEVELAWLWREATRFKYLTLYQAEELKQIVEQIAQSKRSLENQVLILKGIKVDNQVWCAENMDVDVGLESTHPTLDGKPITSIGRLYTFEGAKKVTEMHKNWRLPTEKDYKKLFRFLLSRDWGDITQNMQFHFASFKSKKIPDSKLERFFEQNKALSIHNCGFYWTNDIVSYLEGGKRAKSRKYIQISKLNRKIIFKESHCSNQNMFSLRLIRST